MPNKLVEMPIGKKVHMLTLTDTYRNDTNRLQAIVDCDCGKKGHVVQFSRWVGGGVKSCGCLRTGPSDKRQTVFPIGETFGKLTLKSVSYEKVGSRNKPMAIVDCGCGSTNHKCQWNHLKDGRIATCGCGMGKFTHGGSGTLTHDRWKSMKSRVRSNNPKTRQHYKDRGITVCDRWDNIEDGFVNFLADMGECSENLELDRIDNDKGYSPENCRWVTKAEQVRNRRYKRERSPYHNVFPYSRFGWKFSVMLDGVRLVSESTFTNPKDAALEYNKAASRLGVDPIKEVLN